MTDTKTWECRGVAREGRVGWAGPSHPLYLLSLIDAEDEAVARAAFGHQIAGFLEGRPEGEWVEVLGVRPWTPGPWIPGVNVPASSSQV